MDDSTKEKLEKSLKKCLTTKSEPDIIRLRLFERFVPCKLNNEKHEKHQKDRESFMKLVKTVK